MKNSLLIITFISVFNINISLSQWIVQTLPLASGRSLSMDFSDNDHGIVCGGFIDFNSHARASYTTNSGADWRSASIPDSGKFFYSVKFVNVSTAYMGGTFQPFPKIKSASETSDRSEWKAYFLKSVNYGKDWASINSKDLETYNNLEAIDFINEKKGIAIANDFKSSKGNTDKIIMTTDAGVNWKIFLEKNNSVPTDLISVQYAGDDFICAAGNQSENNILRGLFFRTADGGSSWDTITIDDLTINNFCFTDRFSGYLLGTNSGQSLSMLYKTSNGGLDWEHIQTFTDNLYNGVTFLKESGCGLLYGYRRFFENPVVSLSQDYGKSWRNQIIPPTTELFFTDAVILNKSEMNVTGGDIFSSSIVLQTTNGGLTFINNSTENPEENNFFLFQNYPNPFNPVTVINYELKMNSKVTLKIYNVSGNEIETLVDENQEQGAYSVKFVGTSIPSGIYFYSLKTGPFIETKKMILIR